MVKILFVRVTLVTYDVYQDEILVINRKFIRYFDSTWTIIQWLEKNPVRGHEFNNSYSGKSYQN